MAKKTKKKEVPKLIHLPRETVTGLDELAHKERMTTKPYMERVLIDHSKNTAKKN